MNTSLPTLPALLADATDSILMGGESPFKAHLAAGHGLGAVITGANASGKSLYSQIVAGWANKQKIVPITISIRERTGAGQHEMSGMRRIMMFGDESEQSTGATSVRVCESGLKNLVNYAGENAAMLVLDEPEMGLSEDYAASMGTWLGQQISALDTTNKNIVGVVVISHSRPLVEGLRDAMTLEGQIPHFVSMDQAMTLSAWINDRPQRSVADLLALPQVGNDRRKRVWELLDTKPKRAPKP